MDHDGIIYVPIPKIFHSIYEEGPFSKCIVCTRDLLEKQAEYMIEKVFRGTEVIVEYAICDACAAQLGSELSIESTQRMERFLAEKVNWTARIEQIMNVEGEDLDQWIDSCLISGRKRSELDSYQLCARCRGNKIERTILPLMIAGSVAEEINKQLSKKTRDRLDGFVGDYLGLDPEFQNLPVDTPFLLI
ncbi:MAG: hypothetical protein JW828_03075 [Sedimentisphaerales bacterium]|nr:hypothetical protein [Sedimentisphaerales bacterium]